MACKMRVMLLTCPYLPPNTRSSDCKSFPPTPAKVGLTVREHPLGARKTRFTPLHCLLACALAESVAASAQQRLRVRSGALLALLWRHFCYFSATAKPWQDRSDPSPPYKLTHDTHTTSKRLQGACAVRQGSTQQESKHKWTVSLRTQTNFHFTF